MPSDETTGTPNITVLSDSQSTVTEERPNAAESDQEVSVTAELKYTDGQKTKPPDAPSDAQTPKITPPVSCSTERVNKRAVPVGDTNPPALPRKLSTVADRGMVDLGIEGGGNREP